MDEELNTSSGNVRVVCRFRPLNQKELEIFDTLRIEISEDNKNLQVISKYDYNEPLKFNFDYIFGTTSTQAEVYEIAGKPIIEAVMQGFNGTIFAYGQSSSGKTFTMTGVEIENNDLMGIIPRMISTVFDKISNSDTFIEYTVKVSYCEIYMEKLKDLLETSKNNLKVHEDKTRGVFIAELTEKYVASESEVYEIMKCGLNNRNVGYTDMNAVSSRSHSLFIITISQFNKRDYIAKTGKLYLVDLAGSEKISKSNAAGIRLEEAKTINKSLTMLGLVIYSLTDGKSTHIPYRDSKLTRVLQDSLGGNSKTSLIVTCSPSPYNEAETISTLRFGMRAKAIKNTPRINRELTVAELKLMLANCREEISKKDKKIRSLEEKLEKFGEIVCDFEEQGQEQEILETKSQAFDEIISELEDTRTKLAEEVEISSNLKAEMAKTLEERNFDKEKIEVLTMQNKKLKEKLKLNKSLHQEKDLTIEKLTLTKNTFENDIHFLTKKMLELERKVSEKDAEIKNFSKNTEKESSKKVLEEVKGLVKKEREISLQDQIEIHQLRQNITDLISSKDSEFKFSQIMCEEIARKENDK